MTVTRDDLEVLGSLISLRLPLRIPEARRAARVGELLRVTAELTRTLSLHTQHALVDYKERRSTSDVAADMSALYLALSSYAALLRDVAAEYRSLVRAPAREPVLDDDRASPHRSTLLRACPEPSRAADGGPVTVAE